MGTLKKWLSMTAVIALPLTGCSDDSLSPATTPETEFDVQATRVETFEEVEIHVQVHEGGAPVMMEHGEVEVTHEGDGEARHLGMEADGDGYMIRMMFFEPGEHRLGFHGMRRMHDNDEEFGEHHIEVHRRHHVIGDYWVEMEVDPAPVLENASATIRLFIFDLAQDGTPGDPAAGLQVAMKVHDPDAVETVLTVGEAETGVYSAGHTFGDVGLYELHVEIGDPADTGEFHIPVLTSIDETGVGHDDHHGGGDHGGMRP